MRQHLPPITDKCKQTFIEVFIRPGFYIFLSIGMLFAVFFIHSFVNSIGPAGFSPESSSAMNFIYNILIVGFGNSLVNQFFSNGPFTISLLVSFLPVFLYISISFVYHFKTKNMNIKIFDSGSANSTINSLTFLIINCLLVLFALIIFIIFFMIAAFVNNLVFANSFIYEVILLFLLSVSFLMLASVISVLINNYRFGIVCYVLLVVYFIFSQIADFVLLSGYLDHLFDIISLITQWISPVYIFVSAVDFVYQNNIAYFFLYILYFFILNSFLLFLYYLSDKLKGSFIK